MSKYSTKNMPQYGLEWAINENIPELINYNLNKIEVQFQFEAKQFLKKAGFTSWGDLFDLNEAARSVDFHQIVSNYYEGHIPAAIDKIIKAGNITQFFYREGGVVKDDLTEYIDNLIAIAKEGVTRQDGQGSGRATISLPANYLAALENLRQKIQNLKSDHIYTSVGNAKSILSAITEPTEMMAAFIMNHAYKFATKSVFKAVDSQIANNISAQNQAIKEPEVPQKLRLKSSQILTDVIGGDEGVEIRASVKTGGKSGTRYVGSWTRTGPRISAIFPFEESHLWWGTVRSLLAQKSKTHDIASRYLASRVADEAIAGYGYDRANIMIDNDEITPMVYYFQKVKDHIYYKPHTKLRNMYPTFLPRSSKEAILGVQGVVMTRLKSS